MENDLYPLHAIYSYDGNGKMLGLLEAPRSWKENIIV
jgi:hypothetical protein